MKHKFEPYMYFVRWSDDDKEFVATCPSFPFMSYLADSPDKALQGLTDAVDLVCQDMMANGEELP